MSERELTNLYNSHINMNFENDPVNKPNHYTVGQIEVIDYIKDKLTPQQFEGYCLGNMLKYFSRYQHKNGVEDVKKGIVYAGWLVESLEGDRHDS